MSPSLLVSLSLLLLVPLTAVLDYVMRVSPVVIFIVSGLGVAAMADWIRRGTEQLAARTGPSIGGLVNVSFGNLGELILAVFVLARGQHDVVRAQITGSIIGTTLLGLGVAGFVGGMYNDRQRFRQDRASLLSTLLITSVVALLLPAVFEYTRLFVEDVGTTRPNNHDLSLGVSIVLIAIYAGNLIYTLISRRDAFARDEEDEAAAQAAWPLWASLSVLIAASFAIAFESDVFSDTMTIAAGMLHLNRLFLGIVVLGLIGTVSDVVAGVYFAVQGRIGLVVGICIGSATQIALLVAPLLVIISWLIGSPMSLIFRNPLELFAIAGAVYVVNSIASDGEITWFEGILLIGVYVLFALSFFLAEPA